ARLPQALAFTGVADRGRSGSDGEAAQPRRREILQARPGVAAVEALIGRAVPPAGAVPRQADPRVEGAVRLAWQGRRDIEGPDRRRSAVLGRRGEGEELPALAAVGAPGRLV